MRSGATLFTTAVLCIGAVFVSRDAWALGPVDVEVAGKLGAGTNPIGGYPNPLGFGLGARGGVVFGGLYGGVSLMYYVGSSQANVTGPLGTPTAGNQSASSLLYGIEGGYGGKLFRLIVLRGQLGIGNFTLSQSGAAASGSASNLYLEPSLTGLLSFGMLIVGADAGVLILPGLAHPVSGTSSWDAAFTMHAQAGIKF